MTKTHWFAGAALAATFAAAALAQSAMPHGGPMMAKTRAEVQAKIAEHFKRIDANGDGVVTQAEIDAAHAAMQADRQKRHAERRGEKFARLDTDRNGVLSKDEYLAGPAGHGDMTDHGSMMNHKGMQGPDGMAGPGMMDSGGDHGAMMMRHHRMGGMGAMGGGGWLARADADHDGKLTLGEASAHPLEMFDRADSNKDGTISPEEHAAARAAMRAKMMPGDGAQDGHSDHQH